MMQTAEVVIITARDLFHSVRVTKKIGCHNTGSLLRHAATVIKNKIGPLLQHITENDKIMRTETHFVLRCFLQLKKEKRSKRLMEDISTKSNNN